MIPSGPDAKTAFTRGFFDVGVAQNPGPQTVAIVEADQEFSRNAAAFGSRKRKRHARETAGVGPLSASQQLS
jgi:branched-chain amino acid transport system substrate-binding protein